MGCCSIDAQAVADCRNGMQPAGQQCYAGDFIATQLLRAETNAALLNSLLILLARMHLFYFKVHLKKNML